MEPSPGKIPTSTSKMYIPNLGISQGLGDWSGTRALIPLDSYKHTTHAATAPGSRGERSGAVPSTLPPRQTPDQTYQVWQGWET